MGCRLQVLIFYMTVLDQSAKRKMTHFVNSTCYNVMSFSYILGYANIQIVGIYFSSVSNLFYD